MSHPLNVKHNLVKKYYFYKHIMGISITHHTKHPTKNPTTIKLKRNFYLEKVIS